MPESPNACITVLARSGKRACAMPSWAKPLWPTLMPLRFLLGLPAAAVESHPAGQGRPARADSAPRSPAAHLADSASGGANMSGERWTLAQALAWIACRRALSFSDWTDAAPFAPMFGPSSLLAPLAPPCDPAPKDALWRPSGVGPSVAPAAAKALAHGDDGISEALAAAVAELKRAAVAGSVTIEGRRARPAGSASSVTAVETIPVREFTRRGLTAYPASDRLGPDDSSVEEEEIGWWTDVAVDAHACRLAWPAGAIEEVEPAPSETGRDDAHREQRQEAADRAATEAAERFTAKQGAGITREALRQDMRHAGYRVRESDAAFDRLPDALRGRRRR